VSRKVKLVGPTTPRCGSYECPRLGYIKSEQWGLYLCSDHAIHGPVPWPEQT
jgi:hypothetical protein